ncbi:MAG: hypothetical protein GY836_10820, partial [Herbaspirillum sp.]|uniref:hypothetical protein n=1 Tax=Herbaspirillum sp. TaxID=1890675 RepID=UPI002583B267
TEVSGSLNIATVVDIDASSAVTSGVTVATDGALSTDLTHLSAAVTADSDATVGDSAVNTVANSGTTVDGGGLADGSGSNVTTSLTTIDGVSLTVATERVSVAIDVLDSATVGDVTAVSEIALIGAGSLLSNTVAAVLSGSTDLLGFDISAGVADVTNTVDADGSASIEGSRLDGAVATLLPGSSLVGKDC